MSRQRKGGVMLPPETVAMVRQLFDEANRAAAELHQELAKPIGRYDDRAASALKNRENEALFRVTCHLRIALGLPDRPTLSPRKVSAV